MGDLSNSERGDFGVCLAGASVTRTATLFGVSSATVSEVMFWFTVIIGKQLEQRGNSGQN
jgi:hypothetical protein